MSKKFELVACDPKRVKGNRHTVSDVVDIVIAFRESGYQCAEVKGFVNYYQSMNSAISSVRQMRKRAHIDDVRFFRRGNKMYIIKCEVATL